MPFYERLDIYRLALDQAYTSVVITTAELDRPGPVIVYVNRAFCTMTGYEADEVIGATPRILQGPRTDPALLQRLRRSLSAGESFQGSTINYRKDGIPYLVEWNITPVRDEEGEVEYFISVQRDVTARVEAEQFNQTLLTSLGEGVFGIDVEGRFTFVNPTALRLLGYDGEDELLGHNSHQLTHHTDTNGEPYPEESCPIHRVMQTGDPLEAWQDQFWRRDGSSFPVEVYATPLWLEMGTVFGGVVVFRDISEQKRLEAEQRLLATAFHTSHALLITDPAGTIERVNAAFTTITGYTPEEVIGANPRILASGQHHAGFYATMWRQLQEQDHWEGEIWNRRRNGEIYPEWESITAVRDEEGKVANYVAVFHEITEQKRLEAELERQANHDRLTGIYNRTKLYELLEAARGENERYGTPFSVIMFDIDHFKAVNDTYGHGAGDAVLRELTERVQGVLRETDHLGRWGGEEFLILAGHADRAGAEPLAERIRAVVADEPFPTVGVVTVSLGVAQFRSGETLEHLEERADEALYTAKEAGRNQVRLAKAPVPRNDP